MQPRKLFNNLLPSPALIISYFSVQFYFMKRLTIIVLLLPFVALAQDSTQKAPCKLTRETDPYTRETKLSTGFIFFDGGSVTFDADGREIDVLFSIEGADKCFDNNSMAAVFFEGTKTKLSSRNGGTMNCEGLFHFIYKNTASTSSLLQKMTTQKITHIIFTGNNKKETRVEIGPNEQQAIIAQATCLVNEAKTLIR